MKPKKNDIEQEDQSKESNLEDIQTFINECIIDSPRMKPIWFTESLFNFFEEFSSNILDSTRSDSHFLVKTFYFFLVGSIVYYIMENKDVEFIVTLFTSVFAGLVFTYFIKFFHLLFAIISILIGFLICVVQFILGFFIIYRKFSREQLFILYESLILNWSKELKEKDELKRKKIIQDNLDLFIERSRKNSFISTISNILEFLEVLAFNHATIKKERKKTKEESKQNILSAERQKDLDKLNNLNRQKVISEIFKKM